MHAAAITGTAIASGSTAVAVLLSIFFAITTLVSGWAFTLRQFGQFWPYLVSLAVGFGIQVGLFTALYQRVRTLQTTGMLVTTGSTSTAAMVSCCTHYLANLLPFLGIAGIATIVSQYQIQLFWVGILANIIGILLLLRRFITITIN